MREKIIFISLLGLLLPVSIIIAQVNPSTIDVQNLKRCYNLAHSDSNNNQKTYFEVFPSTFAEFKDIFGYEETKDGDIYGELYEESMEYITKFFLLYKVIDSYDFSNKIINLCINGEWQADGVNYLHANIVNIVTSDSNHDCYYDHFDVLICYNDTLRETLLSCLEQYSEDDILSFWQFYLDGSQVIPVDEELLNRTKCFIRKYPILFKQIDKAYALSQRKKIFNAQINYKEDEIYFYHGDHLGSANWITDAVGQPVQYIHYAPYGELIADTRLTDYRERFTFTGKERDKESGYDYFGARYYWALLMHWLSVDPLAHKYPWLSPYAYCGWNPIKYFDPDGRELVVSFNTTPHNQSHTDYIKNSYLKYYSQKNYSNSSPIIHFWAHGAHNGIRLGDDTAIRTPQGMYEYLNNQSLEFKANCATGEPSVLVLHSCSTGSGKNSFAQQLSTSEYFSKTLVIAPSSILEVGEKETIKDSGGWIAFYNGSPVGSINGYDTPWYKFWGEQKEAVQLSDFFKDMTVEQIFKYFNIENNK